jgi:hypothetical protein
VQTYRDIEEMKNAKSTSIVQTLNGEVVADMQNPRALS